MRDSTTERIGIYKVGYIFTKEIGWIFREQPIVDVGIDAFIEQSIEGNPTGRIIAAQIKTGKGNFHINDMQLTHYISKIHRNYWLNFNLPVILIGHLPDEDETYWEVITKDNLRRTNNQWKLIISKNRVLNSNSTDELTRIIETKKDVDFLTQIEKGLISETELQNITDELESIGLSNKSISSINDSITELEKTTLKYNGQIDKFVELRLNEFDKKVLKMIKNYANNINSISIKINEETEEFAFHFARGIFAFEKEILRNFHVDKNYKLLRDNSETLKALTLAIENAIDGVKSLRDSVSNLPSKYSLLKKSKIKFTKSSSEIISELKIANSITSKLIKSIEEIIE